jgi:hypothetical protein
MKRLRVLSTLSVLALAAAPLLAEGGVRPRRPLVVQRPGSASSASTEKNARVNPAPATAAGYSVQLNIVTRVQGTSFFRTAVDISNNTTTDGVVASYQYCYTLNGAYQGCTDSNQSIVLHPLDNFHTDDIVAYLGGLNLLVPGAADLSFGTFIVTFSGLPTGNGWEGTVTGRTYSPFDQNDPNSGTVAIAYPGSLFFESATGSLVGIVRDTRPAPTDAGALRTNLGITNTDALASHAPVQVQVSLYDTATGARVGNILSRTLQPGEVTQINDLFTSAAVPNNVVSCIVFVDTVGPLPNPAPTIEGYVNILDGGTQDGAYFELKCSAGCPTFN